MLGDGHAVSDHTWKWALMTHADAQPLADLHVTFNVGSVDLIESYAWCGGVIVCRV